MVFTCAAHVLEDKQITQQELIDVAAQNIAEAITENARIPVTVKKAPELLAEELPAVVEMPPPAKGSEHEAAGPSGAPAAAADAGVETTSKTEAKQKS